MSFRSHRIIALAILVVVYAGYAGAQSASNYDVQLQQGASHLQAGDADRALASADAAIRMAPERWDGYALAGRALLRLKEYEPAADALSHAIERAPSAQQPMLRELRRRSLLQESGGAVASAPAAQAPAVAPVPAPPPAPPAAPRAALAQAASAPALQPSEPAVPVKARTRNRRLRSRADPPVWTDASSGLMWARPWNYPAGARGPWNFQGAQSFCSALRLGGYSNWRLPTAAEAQDVYLASSKKWAWSTPQFDADYGLNAALRDGTWKLPAISADGDTFKGDRLLVWTSTPGDASGEHAALYFGRSYSVKDESKAGVSLAGERSRNPFQGYALCVRPARTAPASP
ncbi:MAG: DUF1566 domain-containing protein [Steroidobacteraceae bacterium]